MSIGPQRGPKSVRAIEAEINQTKTEINSYVMPAREEITIYEDNIVRDRQFTGVIVNNYEPIAMAVLTKPR